MDIQPIGSGMRLGSRCTGRVLNLPSPPILAEIPRSNLGPGCRFGLRLRLRWFLDGV